VLADIVRGVGLGSSRMRPEDLAARASAPAVKEALQQRTADAIAAGVFGVPTFELDGELFWGHDRLDHLAARLEGRLPDLTARAAILEARPRAADRATAPILRETSAR
jgi:2-hydroxychromene-2-carboxylate isomerase